MILSSISTKKKKNLCKFFSTSFVIDNNNFLKNEVANFIPKAISLKSNSNFEDLVLNENFFDQFIKNTHLMD